MLHFHCKNWELSLVDIVIDLVYHNSCRKPVILYSKIFIFILFIFVSFILKPLSILSIKKLQYTAHFNKIIKGAFPIGLFHKGEVIFMEWPSNPEFLR